MPYNRGEEVQKHRKAIMNGFYKLPSEPPVRLSETERVYMREITEINDALQQIFERKGWTELKKRR